ncbi:helix-turn-helix transcriptional regulator [Nocardiopsis rhodophaea]|uniref:helix-turn-helix transcriptional regulator n=1 Tax=Nocardiopsis rhodophaea TaxID=280238 RepID=UPI0031D3ADC2
MKVSRRRRAELVRLAALIRAQAQRAGTPVPLIVEEITRRLPAVSALEAWRLAYGWSRPQVLHGISALYVDDGLAPPGVSTAMLCRWEHGTARPSPEYAQALARLYGTPVWRLNLVDADNTAPSWYRQPIADPSQGAAVEHSSLKAVADSLALQVEAEGAAGGPATLDLLTRAVDFYARDYGDHPPAVLAGEVHRCRSMAVGVLRAGPDEPRRRELRRIAGWLSALLGNLAFHTGDVSGAHIHLGTSARIGAEVGEHRLAAWALGAASMVASFEGRHRHALELADQAGDYADTDLRRAQITSWCRLRALARLGDHHEARRTAQAARRHMDAAGGHGEPGRFGFDTAELELHLAEAHLDLTDPPRAAEHAQASIDLKSTGSGGWAAATTVLARSHAAQRSADDACGLADAVLGAVPPERLRSTTRARLSALVADLQAQRSPGRQVRELTERVSALPAPTAPHRSSPEPNGR